MYIVFPEEMKFIFMLQWIMQPLKSICHQYQEWSFYEDERDIYKQLGDNIFSRGLEETFQIWLYLSAKGQCLSRRPVG